MRVVIDCNVVVSAALGSAVCRAALAECELRHVILLDQAILAEYRRVATYPKFKLTMRERMSVLIDDLENVAEHVQIPRNHAPTGTIRDPDDMVYLIVAEVAQADLIMTGNSRDFVETSYGRTRVITARAFLEEFG